MKPSLLFALTVLAGCHSAASTSTVDSPSTGDSAATIDSAAASDAVVSPVDCSAATAALDKIVCQANGFLGTLSSTELATANPAFTDTVDRTRWSNLPTSLVARSGIQMGALGASSQAAALALMRSILSSDGLTDLEGVRAADDYLAANGGNSTGGPGGSTLSYGSALYYIAIFGTPSTTGTWSVLFGGHHMAYSVTVTGGVAYPTPNHLGVEPKAAFTLNGTSYQPMAGEGAAMVSLFGSLSATQLQTAYLTGQTFGDVLIGPVEYGTGSSQLAKAKYPTGANRTGVLVSSLSTAQQALVSAAIAQWVADFDPAIASALLATYTSDSAYADTYVAWGGSGRAPDVETSGTYLRIDGPRVWIEMACQGGIVIQGVTHFHSIYRDKQLDYAGTL